MNSKKVNGPSPTKKWTGLLEKTEKRKEIELQKKAMVALAKTEHELGKIFLDFFIASFNLIIYHRGLHSKSFFAMRECSRFGIKIPYMRFPETIVYLEKVTEKGVNCLMSDLLEGFIFEERDRFGNTIMFMFKLHGSARITPTTLLFTADILSELTESCGDLLHELIRTLSSIPPILQPNMFRWKIELGLKKVDKPDSKWDANKQGIFDDDPDWKIFPWLRNVRGARRRDSFQEVESSSSEISSSLTDPNPGNKTDVTETDRITESNGSQKINVEESVDEDFFDTNNFHDVTLEEDMGSGVLTDYEKEGLSMIEYDEENQQQDENNGQGDRPGSPDMFADSPQPEAAAHSTTSNIVDSSPISYHMENVGDMLSAINGSSNIIDTEDPATTSNPPAFMEIDNDHLEESTEETEDCRGIFTQTEPPVASSARSKKSKRRLPDCPKAGSSPDIYQDVTTIYEDFEDFDDLDKVLEYADSDESDLQMNGAEELLLHESLTNSDPKGVKFYCAATSQMLDTLVCNILIFKDTNADDSHSDYKPPVAKKKMKRSSDNESS